MFKRQLRNNQKLNKKSRQKLSNLKNKRNIHNKKSQKRFNRRPTK